MPSTCRDFEPLCQAALDRREADGLGPALAAHAAACPDCRPIYARYLHLKRAIRALPAPVAADGLADRVMLALGDRPQSTIRFGPRAWAAAALAASLLIAGVLGFRDRPWPEPAGRPVVAEASPRPLGLALSDATDATYRLAREATGPPARVGRQVIRSASIPSMSLGLALSGDPASDVLRSVGSEVEAGVRPLSAPARSAFDFLIPGGSRPGPAGTRPAPKESGGT